MAQQSGGFNLNARVNEYMFARIIEDHNIDVRHNGGTYISAKDGRALHDEWLRDVGSRPYERKDSSGVMKPVLDSDGNVIPSSLENISRAMSRQSLVKVLGPHLNADNPWRSEESAKTVQSQYFEEWAEHTGIFIGSGPAKDDRLAHGVQFADTHAIPCSPFDEQYSQRETMLQHGTEILWARPEDILIQVKDDKTGRFGFRGIDESLVAQRDKNLQFLQIQYQNDDGMGRPDVDVRTHTWSFKEAGPMATTADVAGITRLREFMTPQEFTVAVRHMANVPENQRMTPSMTDRSVALFEMFRDNGIPYSVKPDQNVGQLKATIGNTKMHVRVADRVTDADSQGTFIGRVYNDGDHVRLTARHTETVKKSFVPTIEDTKNVVMYAMGRSVDRVSRAPGVRGRVGTLTHFKDTPDKLGARTTFFSANKDSKPQLTALYSLRRNPVEPVKENGRPNHIYVYIQTGNNHSNPHMDFHTSESAEDFLKSSIQSARDNFEKKVNIDYLVQEHQEHPEDDYVPILSGDPSISPIQLTYWNVLRGNQELYQPAGSAGTRDPSFEALMSSLNAGGQDEQDFGADEDELLSVHTEYDVTHGADKYIGTPEQNIRAHLRDNVDLMFGQYDVDDTGTRFSPSLVASFMESAHGVARNKDNLVAAMRKLEFTGDELKGNDFETGTIKDKLLRFNSETARPMKEVAQEEADRRGVAVENTFMYTMMNTIVDTLNETACEISADDILIDDMGVVQYKAQMMFSQDRNVYRTLVGEIGQIFEPDEDGVVETKYNGSQNKLFTPGYDVYIVPETEKTKDAPLEERYRFRGLPQVLHENIQQTLRYDVHNIEESFSDKSPEDTVFHTGTTTSLNNTYRGLYHTGYKVSIEQQKDADGKPTETLKETYLRQMEMTHMPREVLSSVFATARGMVHFGKDVIEGSSVNAEYRFNQQQAHRDRVSVHELTNDNVQDPYELTGHANMAITAENSDRLFDPVMTGSGKNQGAIRYFVKGAGVEADGRPHFSTESPENLRTPIMLTADQVYADYIPADRQQMEASNYMTASGIAGSRTELDENGNPSKGIGVAQLTLQGLTFDDGAAISKSFAERYGVIGDGGQVRPLMPGDKICDMAGNKSIVARVIDPDMPLDEAKAKGIDLAVQLFRDNPSLDVVQAPYSAVSRFNAAGAKHAMQNPEDLKMPDGTVVSGAIGFTPITITHHTAEDHTKSYDDEDVKQGKGRKVSTQQAWMLDAKGATQLLKEIFEPNNNATVNMREYLNTLGYDMSETGKMRIGYQPHNGEERYVFKMPDDSTLDAVASKSIATKDIASMFTDTVGTRGGFMELPFPLNMPSGEQTQLLDREKSSRPDRDMYALPVMSAHLRSGQTFEDGTKTTHDYTNQYQIIYQSAISYMTAERALASGDGLDDKQKASYEKTLRASQKSAQQAYESITDDVMSRKFESKHNIARDELMARRMPNSATAVWTPNPMLGVNQVAMPQSLADTLSVKEGDRVMVNRDPLLRVYGMRDMEVVIDNDLHGVAVHPAIAVSFDGDFDGDSVGLWAPKTQAAKDEAYRLFSFEQNMLDHSHPRENGDYALMFNDTMDIISAEAVDKERHDARVAELTAQYGDDKAGLEAAIGELPPTLYERRMSLEHAFNEVERDMSLSDEERMRKNEELTEQLSSYARDVMVPQIGTELISYASPQKHMESLITMVDHKAKGSMGKLNSYMKFAGFEAQHDADGRIIAESVKDTGHTLATMQDIRDTELATAIKSHGTGNAGAVSQRAVAMLRNGDALEPALNLTYLATQGILQAKHDPVQAQMLYAMVNSDIRNAWRGYAMDQITDDNGRPRWTVRRDDGKPVQATPEEWVKTFMDMHTAKDGLDLGGAIDVKQVEQVAAALTGPDGRMMNLEDPETVRKNAAPIDYLAYRQSDAKSYLHDMAVEGRNLFEGEYSQYFAPEQIRKNMQAEAEGRPMDLKPLQPADTKVLHNTVNQQASAIDLDVETVMDAKPVRGKDTVKTQAGFFDPSAQAAVEGKSGFNFDYGAKPVSAPSVEVEKPVEVESDVVKDRPVPEIGEHLLEEEKKIPSTPNDEAISFG